MFRNAWILAVAVIFIPFITSARGAITGQVLNSEGEALQGAHVVLQKSLLAEYTDAGGNFKFQNLKKGTYHLSVSYLGYENYRDTIILQDDEIDLTITLVEKAFMTGEVVVQATRLSPRAPGTFENLDKEEIQERNLGQDLPYLINLTPSVVTTSDAGAGVGYTGLRIRGSDQTRINVTVNGIPINDSESQGVFWVNMPDLATSLSSMQIQRGLGSSTNGSGAFGASINMETDAVSAEGGGLIANSFGSFNTHKHSVEFRTGRLENGFAAEGRLSSIQSDGYIDRAFSDLKSYYLSGGYYGKNTLVKAITFGGKEQTYQSWYGTPESRLDNDREGMLAHAAREGYTDAQTENLLESGRTYNFYRYENQTDNYEQTHYQLHLSHAFTDRLRLNLAGHYTLGAGYYEEYERDEDFAALGKPYPIIGSDTIFESDFIVRRWLDNDFYGGTYALNYEQDNHQFILGGGFHFYRGDHFGEIVWAESSETISHDERYYDGVGNKDDYSIYGKWEYNTGSWNFMADMQVRKVDYSAVGMDNDQISYNVGRTYNFFNPKAGARYDIDSRNAVYIYVGRGNREPVRADFIDADPGESPGYETLNDLELGYAYRTSTVRVDINGYYMDYQNQLVLTGQINDVGSPIRENVDNSYRAGVEAQALWQPIRAFAWSGNLTLSRNKIQDFKYVFEGDVTTYDETSISFSPEIIAANQFTFYPAEGLELALMTKYVGEQYLDNTQNENRKIDAYTTTDFRIGYTLENVLFEEIEINLLVNNVFDAKYSANGYTYSYFYEELITENFYYPQAGINFLAGLNLRF